MPAAAVIPAPIAYIKVVAVKKLVVVFVSVGLRACCAKARRARAGGMKFWAGCRVAFTGCAAGGPSFTVRKLECSRQAFVI